MPYIYLFIVFFLFSCGGPGPKEKAAASTVTTSPPPKEVKYVNSIKITSPSKNEDFRFHERINLRYTSKDRFPIDSVQIYLNGKQIGSTGKNEGSFSLELPAEKAGTSVLKIIAFYPEKKKSTAVQSIIVKPDQTPHKYNYEIRKTYAHDPQAYTQGLVYQDGFMYEGTGQYGESGIRKIDMNTGDILSTLNIDSKFFGEGITIFGDKIYQLTWTSRKGFIYDLQTFTLESTFHYDTQGWGLTTMDNKLIMSDGSHKLYQISPSSFSVVKEVEVYDYNGPVERLNELEYIDGLVWANVWMQDRIVLIDPESGEVKGELDLSDLLSKAERNRLDDSDDVLNGIAWNPEKGTVYLSGKRWPKLFEIKIK